MNSLKQSTSTDILFFVEDPGAANFVAPLIPALQKEMFNVKTLADGIARDYLSKYEIAFESNDAKETADQILDQYKPKLLVVGTAENPDTFGLKLVEKARSQRIKSVGVIDARMNTEHRFRGRTDNALSYAPDYILVPDEWTKDSFIKLGYPKDNISVSGNPHYDYVFEEANRMRNEGRSKIRDKIFPDANSNKLIITFVSEGSQRTIPRSYMQTYNNNYNFKGRGSSIGRTEIAIEEILDAIRPSRQTFYLVLRLHPKDDPSDFLIYMNEFDYFSQKENPLETVYASDLVIGMTSMLLLEAAQMSVPVLSIIPKSAEENWLCNTDNVMISKAKNRKELMNAVKNVEDMSKNRQKSVEFVNAMQKNISFLKNIFIN